jgi:hypothetical protein
LVSSVNGESEELNSAITDAQTAAANESDPGFRILFERQSRT